MQQQRLKSAQRNENEWIIPLFEQKYLNTDMEAGKLVCYKVKNEFMIV